MVSKLELILKELNDNSNFYISSFSTANGLILAYHKTTENINANIFTVMSALFLESAKTIVEFILIKMKINQIISHLNSV